MKESMSILRVLTVACLFVAASAAPACTVCQSTTGQQVRAGILDRHFLPTLLFVALPFPILGAITALVYFGIPTTRSERARPKSFC